MTISIDYFLNDGYVQNESYDCLFPNKSYEQTEDTCQLHCEDICSCLIKKLFLPSSREHVDYESG